MAETEAPQPADAPEFPAHAAESKPALPDRNGWIFDILLVVVLLIGSYFRFTGVNWDEYRHLHPDERFLTMVESALSPVKSLEAYFDTSTSTLNPNNQGYGFFVYGTLPIFIVRYAAEALHQTGYDEVFLVGRQLSAIADLLTVFLVYLIALRLYNRKVGLLAAALASFSVLPIQLSHFFTVDTFTNFFGTAAIYFAVIILTEKPRDQDRENWHRLIFSNPWPYLLFGLALGLAAASKINSVVLAGLLPLAALIHWVRLPSPSERMRQFLPVAVKLFLAAVVCLIAFRIFQPYAFSGPGFFDVIPNPHWVDTMKQLSNQTTGDVDFPPALQWARRPISFAWTNMVEWGMGIPMGLLAWAGFLWMGWRIIRKKEWNVHLLLWSWTAVYFAWQSYNWTRSMRYQMLVYPTLAIIAAWAVFELWNKSRSYPQRHPGIRLIWKPLAIVVGIGVAVATLGWAFAFTRIYTRPMTRVEASRWIYQNVPGPLNLKIRTVDGEYSQPLSFPSGITILSGQPFVMAFKAEMDGILTNVNLSHAVDQHNSEVMKTIRLTISLAERPDQVLASSVLTGAYAQQGDGRGQGYKLLLETPLPMRKGTSYNLKLEMEQGQAFIFISGPISLGLVTPDGVVNLSLPVLMQSLQPGLPYTNTFAAFATGSLDAVEIPWMVDQTATPGIKTIRLMVSAFDGSDTMAIATVESEFPLGDNNRGRSYRFTFDHPLDVKEKSLYHLSLDVQSGEGAIAIFGSAPALESTWDDALPQPLDGYSPYDYNNGLYQGDLNFEMYWDDNAAKLDRFVTTMDQADYLFISSNRQWGTTVRVPERYPLTSAYYRNLLGCPEDKDIPWCYAVARPGMFTGKLGYELAAVFQSDPNLGPLQFNDQFAEEAFTVYDHPKVLIFRKTADFDLQQVNTLLRSVDLSQVVHLTPRKAGGSIFGTLFSSTPKAPPPSLMLPPDRLAEEQAGGTWSVLFNRDALQNKYQIIGVLFWYLVVAILGLLAYPLVRMAMPGLVDRGYPLARIAGLLLLAYLVWIGGSIGIPVTQAMISAAFAIVALIGLLLALRQWTDLKAELRQKSRYFLTVEGLTLVFFIAFLLVRLGNPDLWHPYKGGEKPMDFSYLNAVIKSTTYPPYDPWFAGGYINYYYYGFVIVGVLIKWLGIMPSFAYNLFLPMLFSMLAMGVFSIGWNLTQAFHRRKEGSTNLTDPPGVGAGDSGQNLHPDPSGELALVEGQEETPNIKPRTFERPFWIGLSSAIGLAVLGNLGTVRMIWYGMQRLVATGPTEKAPLLTKWWWSFQGLARYISGKPLQYPPGDWYWIPSRTIPGEPITEFPLFTFLYGDPHAHLIALPVTVLALAWAISIVMGSGRWGEEDGRNRRLSFAVSLFLGALVIGALRPMNTWDYPTYLTIGIVALVYTLWRYFNPGRETWLGLPRNLWRSLAIIGSVAGLIGLSMLLYQPFTQWYGQSYNSIAQWNGDHTPFWSYVTHWGLFLFIIFTWLAWETYHWMAHTPMSALIKLRPYKSLIALLLIVWVVIILGLQLVLKVEIAWLVVWMAAWAAILILRPGQSQGKRIVLFLTGTALFLTLAVELIVLVGDIGRMNTVFKFYLQAWTLFAISAAACLGWLIEGLPAWSGKLRTVWQVGLGALITGAALFTILGGLDKINDRMTPSTPLSLDGMSYLATSQYNDQGNILDLSEDDQAIRWMQDHVQGSPVILEGNVPEYRWGTRFTIYTGLPGVVGWNWHQRQQRALLPPDAVTNRVVEIARFYMTEDRDTALSILQQYQIKYVVVGQLEQVNFPGAGLEKFPRLVGDLWNPVFKTGRTTIYEVIR